MISLKKVAKYFGKVHAVDDISFEVGIGEVVGFLGPNGAGKTTTMRLITGFLRPTEGKIKVGGVDPSDDRVAVVEKIGYLPENNPLYVDMKVGEYLKFIANLKSSKTESYSESFFGDVRRAVIEVSESTTDGSLMENSGERGLVKGRKRTEFSVPLKKTSSHLSVFVEVVANKCGVEDKINVKIEELSRGYRQRVGLAAAMLGDPPILILDEPTSGLDPNQVIEMRDLIKKLGKERTVILSTHILQEVEATCNRVIIISKGKIVYDGKVPRRKGQLERIFRKVTLGESN